MSGATDPHERVSQTERQRSTEPPSSAKDVRERGQDASSSAALERVRDASSTAAHERARPARSTVPRRRVVLFGASNLTRAFAQIVAQVRAQQTEPVELLCAHGRGRSYGLASTFLGRELPGILECGVWRALDERGAERTDALLTDIGNDIMYGAHVDAIAGWLDECLTRLTDHGAHVAITRLPIAGIERISRLHYEIVRTLFFPTRHIALETAIERARSLDASVARLAEKHSAALIEADPHWYGLDPIHVRWSARKDAWPKMLSSWDPAARAHHERATASFEDRLAVVRCRPEKMRRFGRARSCAQPSALLADGTTIALY